MKPEDPNLDAWIEPELEARMVAQILGEASEFETAELERLMQDKPEMAVFQRRLEAVHGLVAEASSQGPNDYWKLPKDRRQSLLNAIRSTSPTVNQHDADTVVLSNNNTKRFFWLKLSAAAAMLMLCAVAVTTSMTMGLRSHRAMPEAISAVKNQNEPMRGFSIDMTAKPEVVEVEGFMNYNSSGPAPLSGPLASVADETARPTIESASADGALNWGFQAIDDIAETQDKWYAQAGKIPSWADDSPSASNDGFEGESVAELPELSFAENRKPTDVFFEDTQEVAQMSADHSFGDAEQAGGAVSGGKNQWTRSQQDTDARGTVTHTWDFDSGVAEGISTGIDLQGNSSPALTETESASDYLSFSATTTLTDPSDTSFGRQRQQGQNAGRKLGDLTSTRGEDATDSNNDNGRLGGMAGTGVLSNAQGKTEEDTLGGEDNAKGEQAAADYSYAGIANRLAAPAQKPQAETPPAPAEPLLSAIVPPSEPTARYAKKAKENAPAPVAAPEELEESKFIGLRGGPAPIDEMEIQEALADQRIKTEEARLAILDLAERYRNVDINAIDASPEHLRKVEDESEQPKIAAYSEASRDYDRDKKQLAELETASALGRLQSAYTNSEPAAAKVEAERLIAEQQDRVESLNRRASELAQRYDIDGIRKDSSLAETKNDDDLDPSAAETKKDDAMDERRKLAEHAEAIEDLKVQTAILTKLRRENAELQPVVEAEPAPTPDQAEKHASQEPFSTFSLHVSDVAFKLAKAALLDNSTMPDPDKVRVEEFVNAFDYGDPAPSLADKVASRTEQAAHPFRQQRNLLRVAMRTAAVGRSSSQALRLTLLLDTSGSMERQDRRDAVRRAMEVLTSQLTPSDTVTLIGFARQPRLIQDRLTGEALKSLPDLVENTPSEGGTNLEEALLLATEAALRQYQDGGQNRVVLITDGAANLGDAEPETLKDLVIALRQQGIAFDACGVGAEGLNDAILETLTRHGDGRYYFLDKAEDADAGFARQLAGALRPAARNVKVQVRFNPSRVGHYRLMGFEKHRLKKEDFRNDSVDAAEMAAAESGVALYEVETLPAGTGEIGEVSVRFQDMTSGWMVERSWTIPYQSSVPSLNEASPSIQLAGAAALLAEKLRGSALGAAVRLDELTQVLTNLRQCYDHNARVQDLIAMIEKARSF